MSKITGFTIYRAILVLLYKKYLIFLFLSYFFIKNAIIDSRCLRLIKSMPKRPSKVFSKNTIKIAILQRASIQKTRRYIHLNNQIRSSSSNRMCIILKIITKTSLTHFKPNNFKSFLRPLQRSRTIRKPWTYRNRRLFSIRQTKTIRTNLGLISLKYFLWCSHSLKHSDKLTSRRWSTFKRSPSQYFKLELSFNRYSNRKPQQPIKDCLCNEFRSTLLIT